MLFRSLEEHKINYIDSIIMRHLTILIQSLHADGFDVEDEIFQKDYAFLANVLKATLMRSYGLHNPIQKLMDQIHSDDQEFETEETEATSPDELA